MNFQEYLDNLEKKLEFEHNGNKYKVVGTTSKPYLVKVMNLESKQIKKMNPEKVNKYLPIFWDGKSNK